MKPTAVQTSGAAAALLLSLTAFPACAADGLGPGVSLLGSFVQMLASLAVVIGVIMLFSHFAKRYLKTVPAAGAPKYIRLIETRHLGPKKSLMLVEVGGDYFLLGNSADGVQLIKQVDMLEEIEVVGHQDSVWAQSTGEAIRALLGKIAVGAPSVVSIRNIFTFKKDTSSSVGFTGEGRSELFTAPREGRAGLQQGAVK